MILERWRYYRHYSSKKSRPRGITYADTIGNRARFTGSGKHIVMLTRAADALFVWRAQRFRKDNQRGIECSVFRNESDGLSSDMIREADGIAWQRWPGERHFTYVNGSEVNSRNPGYCFLMAGWRKCGFSAGGLLLMERLP